MGDSFKKVQTGQPLKIPAAAYNAFLDAAKAHQQQQQIGQAGQASSRGHLVLVRNNSAATVDRFGVLAITGTVFEPTNDEFMNRVIFEGDEPSADLLGSFVITAEPIKAGGIGAAFAAGVCPVQIDVTDDEHRQADTANGDAAKLKSGYGGAAAILWREGGTGVQWAIVRLAALSIVGGDVTIDDLYTDGDIVEVGLVWKIGAESTIIPEVQEHFDELVNPIDESGNIVKVSLQYNGVTGRIEPIVDDSAIPEAATVAGIKDDSEYVAAPGEELVTVEWDKAGSTEEHDNRLRLLVDDTALADALAEAGGGAKLATASGTISSSVVQACTLDSQEIDVYCLNGHAWNAFGNFAVDDDVVVWELPAPVNDCDYVGTPLDFFRDTFHEFHAVGLVYSGQTTSDLTVEVAVSTEQDTIFVSDVQTDDGTAWDTRYPHIAVGMPVLVTRVNAAAEYVGYLIGVPDPPSTGVKVLGSIDGEMQWFDTVQVDY